MTPLTPSILAMLKAGQFRALGRIVNGKAFVTLAPASRKRTTPHFNRLG
jgi:hypothetical protein